MGDAIRLQLEKDGWQRYEISNYARRGKICHHNHHYWLLNSYLGIGPAAVGTLFSRQIPGKNIRMQGSENLTNYMQQEDFAVSYSYIPIRESAFEMVMMGLRLVEGFPRQSFRERFAAQLENVFPAAIQFCQQQHWLSIDSQNCRLTTSGLDFYDRLLQQFWQEV